MKTPGVSQPAQTLSRGKVERSASTTFQPATPECPRAGRAGGAAADDEGVAANHRATVAAGRRDSARVQNGGADSRGREDTWNSCIHPVANAAWDPARYSSQARANSSP